MESTAEEASLWADLPEDLRGRILRLAANPCARRVCKAFRQAFDATTVSVSLMRLPVPDGLAAKHATQSTRAEITAAGVRVLNNSPRLTAISTHRCSDCPCPLDLVVAGVSSGLPGRLQSLTGAWAAPLALTPAQLQALGQCTALTQLDISHSHQLGRWANEAAAGGAGAAALTAALQSMRSLTDLRMCDCNLSGFYSQAAAVLASALMPLTQLQHLHLAYNGLGIRGIHTLAPALAAMPGLLTLDIAIWSFRRYDGDVRNAEDASSLCQVLSSTPALTCLNLSGYGMYAEGLEVLAPALGRMTCLQELHLREADLGAAGMAALAPALAQLPYLHTLDLNSNYLGSSSGRNGNATQPLLPLLTKDSPLRTLDLRSNRYTWTGACSFVQTLRMAPSLPPLRTLDLMEFASSIQRDLLDERSWPEFVPALHALTPSLEHLRLCEGERDTDSSITQAFASALRAMTRLTSLGGSFSSQHVREAISPALASMTRLRELVLAFDYGGVAILGRAATPAANAAQAEAWAQALQTQPSVAARLTRFHFKSCKAGNEVLAQVLPPALAGMHGLEELNLQLSPLGARSADWLPQALRGMPCLTLVAMYGCEVGPAASLAIARSLKCRNNVRLDLGDNGVVPGSAELLEMAGLEGVVVYLPATSA